MPVRACLGGPAWALGSTPVTVVNPVDIAKAEGIQQPYQQESACSSFSDSFPSSCEFRSKLPRHSVW